MEQNPYSPPTANSGLAPTSEGQAAGQRSLGEIVILMSLVGSIVFWGYLVTLGSLQFHGQKLTSVAIIAIFLGLGVLSLWLLARRRIVGAIACMVFYGIQVISITLPSGDKFSFNSLPTIHFRILGDELVPTSINLVALVLFVFSVMLWRKWRDRHHVIERLPPNKWLGRTRER